MKSLALIILSEYQNKTKKNGATKMKKQYKDLYAMGILTLITLMITPLIIKWWQVTLYQPIDSEIVEQVQEKHNSDKEVLDWMDIVEINRETILVPVKSLELVEGHEKYYFLRNNEGHLYISDNEDLRHDENYILEVDRMTDEIVNIRFDLEFEFDEVDEDIFTEWYHDDIEQGKEMLNEYLGVEDYSRYEVSM